MLGPNPNVDRILVPRHGRGADLLRGRSVEPLIRHRVGQGAQDVGRHQRNTDDLGQMAGESFFVGGTQLKQRRVQSAAIELLTLLSLDARVARDHTTADEGLRNL